MMDVKHTAGEWRVDKTFSTHNSPDRFWETFVLADPYLYTAKAVGASKEEAEANARLIAAAPDLRDALIACEGEIRRLHRAIGGYDCYGGKIGEPNLRIADQARAAIARATNVVVPREPTAAMLEATAHNLSETYGPEFVLKHKQFVLDAWAELLASAPENARADRMKKALEQYRDLFCEGWCKTNGGYFEDCSGCIARRALSNTAIAETDT